MVGARDDAKARGVAGAGDQVDVTQPEGLTEA